MMREQPTTIAILGADTIGIQLTRADGSLLFSSNWTSPRTVEQILGGGNLVVR